MARSNYFISDSRDTSQLHVKVESLWNTATPSLPCEIPPVQSSNEMLVDATLLCPKCHTDLGGSMVDADMLHSFSDPRSTLPGSLPLARFQERRCATKFWHLTCRFETV